MSSDFINHQIESGNLPSLESVVFEKLHVNFRQVSILSTGIIFGFLLVGYLAVGYFVDELLSFPILLIAMIVWSIASGLFMILAIQSFDYKGYALRDRDIIYKSGIFFRSTIIIPFCRVQHCEIEQGPIERWFGLTELTLFTAGGTSSDLSIPGLSQDQANKLKIFITNQVSVDEEE